MIGGSKKTLSLSLPPPLSLPPSLPPSLSLSLPLSPSLSLSLLKVSSLNTTSDDQPDIGAWKRLSGQFAINMVRSPSNLSVSGIDRESKKSKEYTEIY